MLKSDQYPPEKNKNIISLSIENQVMCCKTAFLCKIKQLSNKAVTK